MMLLFLLFAIMAVVAFGDRTTTFTSCSPVQTLNWLGVDIFTFNIGVATGFLQFNVAGAPVEGPAFIIIEVGGLKLIKDLDHNKIYNPAGAPPPSSPLLLPLFLSPSKYESAYTSYFFLPIPLTIPSYLTSPSLLVFVPVPPRSPARTRRSHLHLLPRRRRLPC